MITLLVQHDTPRIKSPVKYITTAHSSKRKVSVATFWLNVERRAAQCEHCMSECHIHLTTLFLIYVYSSVCVCAWVSELHQKIVKFISKKRWIISLTWPYINLSCLPEFHQCLLVVANFAMWTMVELNSRIGNICAPKYTNTFRIMIRITQSTVLFHFQFGSSLCFIRIYVYFVYMFMFIASNIHTEIHFYYQYWIWTTLFWRFRYKWICVKFLFSPFYPQYILHSCWYFWNARIKRIRNIYVIGWAEDWIQNFWSR